MKFKKKEDDTLDKVEFDERKNDYKMLAKEIDNFQKEKFKEWS
jgi:hypothetical protein